MAGVVGRVLESGVPQLDLVLGGGIPVGDLMLLVGAPGAGKTTLACQIAFHAARCGNNVLFVSTLSEPGPRLVKHLQTLSFWNAAVLGERIFFESVFPVVKQGLSPLIAALVSSVRSRRVALLVLDGFATLRDLHPGSRELPTFVNQLAVAMAALGCTTLVTTSDVPDLRGPNPAPEFTMCDSIVELSQQLTGQRQRRMLRAWKVRGAEPLLGPHLYRITCDGVAVYPRIVTHVPPSENELSADRLSWGADELDVLMSGGLPSASSTVVAGVSGTGKTLLALQFLIAGAARGEKGLFVSLRESPRQLVRKARSFQLDLERPLADGRISILRRAPVELEVDEVLHEVWSTIDRVGAARLVFDSTAELEHALVDGNARGAFAMLSELLHARGITTLYLRALSEREGAAPEFEECAVAVLAENVLWLRTMEAQARVGRVLSVLKMRDAAYDPTPREYIIDEQGLRVLRPASEPGDWLHQLAGRSDHDHDQGERRRGVLGQEAR